ncbi:hypothetical protein ACLOJK_032390 [Asimina triloba]
MVVSFMGKGNTKLVSNLPDSVSEWKLKFFYARLGMGEDRWGVPDRSAEKLPEVANAPTEELEARQQLVLAYLQANRVSYEGVLFPLVPKFSISRYTGNIDTSDVDT